MRSLKQAKKCVRLRWQFLLCILIYVSTLGHTKENELELRIDAMMQEGIPLVVGHHPSYGHYVLSIAFSDLANREQAREDAKLQAMAAIGEFIKGVDITRQTVSTERVVVSGVGQDETQYESTFTDEIKAQFAGRLSAIRPVKFDKVDGKMYAVLMLSEHGSSMNENNPNGQELGRLGEDDRSKSSSVWVESIGLASLAHRSRQDARDIAIENALANAVNQASGASIKSQSRKYNRAISIAIASDSNGFVSQYNVLEETTKGRDYHVKIRALVDSQRLVSERAKIVERFNHATFAIVCEDRQLKHWLQKELKNLGFVIKQSDAKATHVFNVSQNQREVTNHMGQRGVETAITVALEDKETSEILFTVLNNTKKTRVFITPEQRARQASLRAATKAMTKTLGADIVSALVI